MSSIKATIIVDNIGAEGLPGEWGLCVHIEHEGKKILLDTGASPLFLANLRALNLDISSVDYAVLSHAHCDHAGGMGDFFEKNSSAHFYIQNSCNENCFYKIAFYRQYEGIPRGVLSKYTHRITRVNGKTELCHNAYLLPHKAPDIYHGKVQHQFILKDGRFVPDDFSHEQSLVLRTEKGLVIFNSCSHIGADSIIREVLDAFPSEKIAAIIGGFHLVGMSKKYIRDIANGIKNTGIERAYTGHCSKERGYRILKAELGDTISQFKTGMIIEI